MRIAAYCRVSTDKDDQLNSLAVIVWLPLPQSTHLYCADTTGRITPKLPSFFS